MDIIQKIKNAGIIGAGGAGFPTHVKMDCKAEIIIANGAECEPLLRCDRNLMQTNADGIVRGLELAMETTGAKKGVIATKSHYAEAVKSLKAAIKNKPNITIHEMEAYYPSGDEKSIVYEVTGKVVPTGKIPLEVGCVVSNVFSLYQMAMAEKDVSVTTRSVTICGDVPTPLTVEAPLGTNMRELLKLTGFEGNEDEYTLIIGGPCMGNVSDTFDVPVTKTSGGALILPKNHMLIARRTMPIERQLRLARTVCCQCMRCTQLCSRNILGTTVQPHKIMLSAARGDATLMGDVNGIFACSSCNLCTDYACEMGLSPSMVIKELKNEFAKAGLKPQPEENIVTDPAIEMKRVPVERLIARMGLRAFDKDAPQKDGIYDAKAVKIPLNMHIGKPSEPCVSVGDTVKVGDLIAKIPEKSLSANIHASINGKIAAVTDSYIEIRA